MKTKSHNPLLGIRYAPIFLRFSSFFIDQIILGVALGFLAGSFSWLSGKDNIFEENFLAYFFFSLFYYSAFISGNWQATPGMKMVGIYVATKDHQKLDIIAACMRYILFIFNIIAAIFLAMFIGKVILGFLFWSNKINMAVLSSDTVLMQPFNMPITMLEMVFGVAMLIKVFIIALPMFFTKKTQTLYDLLAGIVVIKSETIKHK